MAKVKAVFFIPTADNDGRELDAEIDDLEMELTLTFAGWTCQGYVQGKYKMADGSHADDINVSYFAVFDETRVQELKEILRAFKKKTLQETIYLVIHRDVEFHLI